MMRTVIDPLSISPIEKAVQELQVLLSSPPFDDLNYSIKEREDHGERMTIFAVPTVLRLDLEHGMGECEPIMFISSAVEEKTGRCSIIINFEKSGRSATPLNVNSISDINREFAKNMLLHIIIELLSIDQGK